MYSVFLGLSRQLHGRLRPLILFQNSTFCSCDHLLHYLLLACQQIFMVHVNFIGYRAHHICFDWLLVWACQVAHGSSDIVFDLVMLILHMRRLSVSGIKWEAFSWNSLVDIV